MDVFFPLSTVLFWSLVFSDFYIPFFAFLFFAFLFFSFLSIFHILYSKSQQPRRTEAYYDKGFFLGGVFSRSTDFFFHRVPPECEVLFSVPFFFI
jgi:hypothetical protein